MINTIRKILETPLASASTLTLPLVYDATTGGNAEFTRATLGDAHSQATDTGRSWRLSRYLGVYSFQVFTNAQGGSGKALNEAELISNIYRNKKWTTDGCTLEILNVDYVIIGVRGDSGKYQVNVNCEYRATKDYQL